MYTVIAFSSKFLQNTSKAPITKSYSEITFHQISHKCYHVRDPSHIHCHLSI